MMRKAVVAADFDGGGVNETDAGDLADAQPAVASSPTLAIVEQLTFVSFTKQLPELVHAHDT